MGDKMRKSGATKSGATMISAVLCAAGLAGCSDSGILGNPLTTQSINTAQAVPAAPAVDPACYALSQRIELLRRDNFTERIEKASVGKSSTVSVKRASLAQAAELDKANAEYQAKCAAPALRMAPRTTAQTTPPANIAAAAPAAPAPAANTAQVVSASTPPPGATSQ